MSEALLLRIADRAHSHPKILTTIKPRTKPRGGKRIGSFRGYTQEQKNITVQIKLKERVRKNKAKQKIK